MKYRINSNSEYIEKEDKIIVKNITNGNTLSFSSEYSFVFKQLILKGIEDIDVIRIIHKRYKLNRQESLNLLNSVLYALLNVRLLEPICKKNYKNKILYVKSCLLEITKNCNFRCPHCYVDKKHTQYLDYSFLKNIACELRELNCNIVTFTGGEIFTHKNFIKIYEYFYNMGFLISLNTNGYCLSDQIFELLRKFPPCSIEISLYGNDNVSYEKFTQVKNSYDIVTENIKKLKDLGIRVLLKNVFTNLNKNNFDKIRNTAKSLNCKFRYDYIAFPRQNRSENINPEQVNIDEVMNELRENNKIREYYISLYNKPKSRNKKLFKCKVKDDSIFLTADKKVCMCLCMQSDGISYSNLKDNIYDLQMIKNLNFKNTDQCKNCKYISLCRYCPGKFKMSTGSLHIPPQWFCDLGKAVYNNFIKGYCMIRKKYLKDFELQEAYNIISSNMSKLGFVIKKEDEIIWKENIINRLKDENCFFYLVYQNGKICGFVEIVISNDKLIVSEIQLNDKVKNTRVLFKILKTLLQDNNFKSFNDVYFYINNKNLKSIKTFTHLGGILKEQKGNSSLYCLNRNNMVNYFKKFNISVN